MKTSDVEIFSHVGWDLLYSYCLTGYLGRSVLHVSNAMEEIRVILGIILSNLFISLGRPIKYNSYIWDKVLAVYIILFPPIEKFLVRTSWILFLNLILVGEVEVLIEQSRDFCLTLKLSVVVCACRTIYLFRRIASTQPLEQQSKVLS